MDQETAVKSAPAKAAARQIITLAPNDVIADPYPHTVTHNAVEPSLFKRMQAEWPTEEIWNGTPERMGGRNSIPHNTPRYGQFIQHSPAWKEFFAFINSKAFVDQAINTYADHFAPGGCRVDPKALKFSDTFRPENGQDIVSVDYGVTRAHEGYTCKVHHDQGYRLIAFLLFMNDAAEFGGEGGTFNVHRRLAETKPGENTRFVKASDLVEVHKPSANLLVSFLNTRNAYHSVPVMTGTKAFRKFLYLGINVGNKETELW